MKKILFIFSLLGLLISSYGQLQVPAIASSVQVAAGYSAEYQAVYDAMVTPPGTDTTNAQNTMIVSMKVGSAYAQLDWLVVGAQRTEADGLINWITPGTDNASVTGSLVWTQWEGWTGSGSQDGNYVNSNFNPTTDATNYLQDDASYGVYLRISGIDGNDNPIGQLGSSITYMRNSDGSGLARGRINTSDASYVWGDYDSDGLCIMTRSSSTIMTYYHNGSDKGDSSAKTSVALNNSNFGIGNTASYASANQYSVAFIGGNLSDSQVTTINDAIETYMDFLGKGVQP